MAYEVSRRSFLKGAAALAVATAASGLLTACGGGKEDNGFTIGKYKVYFDSPDFGTSDAQGNHFIEPNLKIECIKTDYLDTARDFDKVFSAKIGETNLTLYNRNDKINNMKKGDKYSYAPHFVTKDDALYQKAVNGEALIYLTIDLYGDKATFEVNLKDKTIKYKVR